MTDRHRIELRQLQELRKVTPQRLHGPHLELPSPKASREKDHVPHRLESRFRQPFRLEESSVFPLFNSSSEMDQVLKLKKMREQQLLMVDSKGLDTMKLPLLQGDNKQATIFYPLMIRHHRSKKKDSVAGRSNLLLRNFSQIAESEFEVLVESQPNLELEGTHMNYHKEPLLLPRKKRQSFITVDERRKKLAMYEQKKERRITSTEKKSCSPRRDKCKEKEVFEFPLYISCILSINGVREVHNNARKFKFFLGEGNNSYLVKSTIRKRFWWSGCASRRQANFVWTQLKCKDVIERMKCLNPGGEIDAEYEEPEVEYPDKQQTTEADEQNRGKGTESAQLQPLMRSEDRMFAPLVREQLEPRRLISKLIRQTIEHDDLTEAVASLRKQEHAVLEINNGRIHNHLQCHWHLSNKKALFANLKHYYESVGQDPFQHIPRTYHVKAANDQHYREFQEHYRQNKGVWIIKPGQNTNRGNGITVAQQLSEIESLVTSGCSNSQTVILQEYLMPFLYCGRKFDIRCYMLVTSIAGKIRAYWYDEGYVRTSSKEFTLNNLQNRMIHLTNDAVQKRSDDYGRFESCNKLSFREIDRYFREQSRNFQSVRQQMKSLAADCLKATYRLLDPKKREFTFEVFGLDFLVDNRGKTWLIEANTNPCLELSGSLLARIIPHMLENTLRIVLDPLFTVPEASTWPASRRFEFCSRVFSGNHYELLFDEQLDS